MKLLTKLFALILLGSTLLALPARAQNLVLLLSFENYDNTRNVPGALSNHDALISAYREAGFTVIGGRDRTRDQLRNRISIFMEQLAAADKAVIHLTGHVEHFGQSSWILARDVVPSSAADLDFGGASLDFLLELLAVKANNAVMFVGNPRRGIDTISGVASGVSVRSVPRGVVLIEGSHEDVTRAVINDFLEPGKTVVDALRDNRRRLESSGTSQRGFTLSANPFQAEIDRENAIRLSAADKRAIQSNLSALGYDTGGVDGVFGGRTRTAIRNWQQREGKVVTGYLNAGQVNRIARQANELITTSTQNDRAYWRATGANGTLAGLRSYLRRYPNGVFADRARTQISRLGSGSDTEAWSAAVAEHTAQGYHKYLNDFPRGAYREAAMENLRVLERVTEDREPPFTDADGRLAEARLNLNAATRLLIEARLGGLGYTTGPVDGIFDAVTRRGMRQYQSDRRIPATGYLSADMLRRLLLNH